MRNVENEIATCTRLLEAIDDDLDDLESELIVVVDEHREEWKEAVEADLDAAYSSYVEAVEKLAQVHDALSGTLGLRSWLQFFPEEEVSYVPRGMLLSTLRAPHGDPYMFDQVVSALREDAHVRRREEPRSVSETQRIHEERLANEQAGRGYFTNGEIARLESEPDEFRYGVGARPRGTMPMPSRASGPITYDGALFFPPGAGSENEDD